jgi:hypothetical protein
MFIGRDTDGYYLVPQPNGADLTHTGSEDELSTCLSTLDLHDAASVLFFPDVTLEQSIDNPCEPSPPLPTLRQVLTKTVLMSMASGAISALIECARAFIFSRHATPARRLEWRHWH